MENKLKHFAIYVDNIDRVRKFYSNLFGWSFTSYGQEDFLQVRSSSDNDAPPIGALQSRRYSPLKEKIIGFECSIEVEDIDQTLLSIVKNGGEVVMPKTSIPHVGWLIKFLDTEGNIVCAVQYDNTAK